MRTAEQIKERLLAGVCTMTIVSKKTNERVTIKVLAPMLNKKRDYDSDVRTVKVMTGSDNTSDFTQVGLINIEGGIMVDAIKYCHKFKVGMSRKREATKYFWSALQAGDLSRLEILESSHCARCGKKLTTPQSIKDGFGPECVWKFKLPTKAVA